MGTAEPGTVLRELDCRSLPFGFSKSCSELIARPDSDGITSESENDGAILFFLVLARALMPLVGRNLLYVRLVAFFTIDFSGLSVCIDAVPSRDGASDMSLSVFLLTACEFCRTKGVPSVAVLSRENDLKVSGDSGYRERPKRRMELGIFFNSC